MDRLDTGSFSIDEKIGQLFFIGIPGDIIDNRTEELLKDIRPGGVCLFARNIRGREQTRDLLDNIRNRSAIEPFLSVDQEGGLVDRLKRILAPMPAPSMLATPQDVAELAKIIAEAVRILGFNMDFAPVVDVIDAERSAFSNGLHSRSLGNSSLEVVQLAAEFLEVLQANGCMGCIKHFPGLGASEVDSHAELPSIPVSEDTLHFVDLYPYRELIKNGLAHAVMVAHAVYPTHHLQEVDQNGKLLPSSLSSNFVTTLLRQHLNFDGLIITDDLEMGAIVKNYGIGEACIMAILAGQDMVSICANVDAIYEGYSAVKEAYSAGRIAETQIETSFDRILTVKSKLEKPLEFSTERLEILSSEINRFSERLNN